MEYKLSSTSQLNTEHFHFTMGRNAEMCFIFIFSSNAATGTLPGTVRSALTVSHRHHQKNGQSNPCPGYKVLADYTFP